MVYISILHFRYVNVFVLFGIMVKVFNLQDKSNHVGVKVIVTLINQILGIRRYRYGIQVQGTRCHVS